MFPRISPRLIRTVGSDIPIRGSRIERTLGRHYHQYNIRNLAKFQDLLLQKNLSEEDLTNRADTLNLARRALANMHITEQLAKPKWHKSVTSKLLDCGVGEQPSRVRNEERKIDTLRSSQTAAKVGIREKIKQRKIVSADIANQDTQINEWQIKNRFRRSPRKQHFFPFLITREFGRLKEMSTTVQVRKKIFDKRLEQATSSKASREDNIASLELFLLDRETKLNASELKSILYKFWEFGAYDQIIEMMDNNMNSEFTTDINNCMLYSQCLLKSSEYFNPARVQSLLNILSILVRDDGADYCMVESMKGVLFNVVSHLAANALIELDQNQAVSKETERDLRRAFPHIETYDEHNLTLAYREALNYSIVAYENATVGYDPRYCSRLMHNYLENGQLDQAKHLAEITLFSTQGRQVELCNNTALLRSHLEAMILLGKKDNIEFYQAKLLASISSSRLADYTLLSLNNLKALTQKNPNSDLEGIIQQLEELSKELRVPQNVEAIVNKNKERAIELYPHKGTVTQDIYDHTSTLREKNGVNSGNIPFGGILPDTNINRSDFKIAKEILSQSVESQIDLSKVSLSDDPSMPLAKFIHKPEEFIQILHYLVRSRFKTTANELERLDSKGHKEGFDDPWSAILKLSGLDPDKKVIGKYIPDSRTNLTVNFAIGIGDCRHHANMMQLLFDVAHEMELNEMLAKLQIAQERGEPDEIQSLTEQIQGFNSIQLIKADTVLHSFVKLEGGLPEWDDQFNLQVYRGRQDFVAGEEHTLNFLILKNPDTGVIEHCIAVDAFYHGANGTFNFKYHEVDLTGKSYKPVQLSSDKEPVGELTGLDMGEITLLDPVSQKEMKSPVKATPTAYAKNKVAYNKNPTESRLIGLPVEHLSLLSTDHDSVYVHDYFESLKKWAKENSNRE
jgi:hypothetical protein